MAACPACGTEIRTITLEDDGRRVTIDSRSEFGTGPDRYFVDGENPSRGWQVRPNFEGFANSDHTKSCSAAEPAI